MIVKSLEEFIEGCRSGLVTEAFRAEGDISFSQ